MAASSPEQKAVEKSLQKENKALRNEIKQGQNRVKAMQGDLNKSNAMKDRLEALCRELQKQNRFIKAESAAKIQEANEKGKELATEVQNNMGFMKNINENLASITAESQKVRKENEELAKKVGVLQDYYEQREKILQEALDEAKTGMLTAKTHLAEFQVKNAQEKEKLLIEMQQLANALEKSRDEIKHAKETEDGLRNLIQSYDEKFTSLQKALQDTNGAYTGFKAEMERVTLRTKELEKDTLKWQQRWEESNTALVLMRKNHEKIHAELCKSHESLETMTNLCRALQNERKELISQVQAKDEGVSVPESHPPPAEGVKVPENRPPPAEGVKVPESLPPPAEGVKVLESPPPPAEGVKVPEIHPPPTEGVKVPEIRPPPPAEVVIESPPSAPAASTPEPPAASPSSAGDTSATQLQPPSSNGLSPASPKKSPATSPNRSRSRKKKH